MKAEAFYVAFFRPVGSSTVAQPHQWDVWLKNDTSHPWVEKMVQPRVNHTPKNNKKSDGDESKPPKQDSTIQTRSSAAAAGGLPPKQPPPHQGNYFGRSGQFDTIRCASDVGATHCQQRSTLMYVSETILFQFFKYESRNM